MNEEMNEEYNEGCIGCSTIVVIILLVIFMLNYKCSTKEVVKDVTKVAKEYVTIIDSVWNEK